MSVNTSRAKLNKAVTNKEYRAMMYSIKYPIYWDEGLNLYPRKVHTWSKGPGKQIMSYQIRMYKTWKYNRKTQWKDKI